MGIIYMEKFTKLMQMINEYKNNRLRVLFELNKFSPY